MVREVLKSTAHSGLSKMKDAILGNRNRGAAAAQGLNANQRFIEGLAGAKRNGKKSRSLSPPRSKLAVMPTAKEEEEERAVEDFLKQRNELLADGNGNVVPPLEDKKNLILGFGGAEKRTTTGLFGEEGERDTGGKKKSKWSTLKKHLHR